TYYELERFLNVPIVEQKALIIASKNEMGNDHNLLQEEQIMLDQQIYNTGSLKTITPVYHVKNLTLLAAWTDYLTQNHILRNETFLYNDCKFESGEIHYQDIVASNIIFCEGAGGHKNTLFPNLPFTKNKGNVLILHIPELSEKYI